MRGLILLLSFLFSFAVKAGDIQQRITFFTQQSDLLRQICFMPDGTFLTDRILFDQNGSIRETTIDCNAQALALEQEHNEIEAFIQSDQCPADLRVGDTGLIDLLNGNAPIVEELACPGIRSATDCMNNLSCNLMRSIVPAASMLARQFSNHPMISSCDGTGSCLTNLGKAIWDNLWDTVKGLYNIGSMAVSWAGDKIASLFSAEDQTSNRGIAATEATDSELDQFLAHPLDYLYNKGAQILTMMSDGIKERYGCAKWTGLPHVSECVEPMSWECADCNEKLNMFCGIAGYIGANVISNFFTGGTVAAVQITGKIAASTVFRIARSVPGAARITEAMSAAGRAGRIGKASALVSGTVRAAWLAVKGSRTVQGTLSVAKRLRAAGAAVNGFARKKIFLFARGQDAAINAVRAYTRVNLAAYKAGYQGTFRAAERAREYLYSQFPKAADVAAGRYANVSSPQDYLRESTKNMKPEDRRHMRVAITVDGNNQRRLVVYDQRAGALDSDIRFNFQPQTPAAPPATVARSVAAVDEVPTIETVVVTARRRPPTREEFIEDWKDYRLTDPAENRRFIAEAAKGEQPGVFYLDTQNTALKKLNDTLRNKQLVDAFGNRYNDLVMQALEEFKDAHPGVTVSLYSDYKSMRASIRGPPGQEEALMAELGRLIDRTDETFIAELRRNNLVQLEENERWFRSGIGRTADEANLVTRFSRRDVDVNTVTFGAGETQGRIRSALSMTEGNRAAIQNRFANTPLLQTVEGTAKQVPTAEVLEVVRKNNSPDDIARILSGRYSQNITKADAELLQQYFNRVDQFSPGLMIPARVEHRFDQAVHGGFSIDFAGVGSVNAEATAIGLAEGRSLSDAVIQVRRNELAVTAELDALKSRTANAVRNTLSRHGIHADITISGDDMIVVPSRALTPEIRREIAEAQVAAQRGTETVASGMRTSFFNEGIPDQAARSIQSTIGESVEKKIRSRLEGRLSQDELRNTLFAIEMRGTSAGTGDVAMEIVNPNLSPASRRLMETELREAVNAVNAELRAQGQVGTLNAVVPAQAPAIRNVPAVESWINNSAMNMGRYVALQGKTDREIRLWYLDQVNTERINSLNRTWASENISLRARAQRTYQIRHDSRQIARHYMSDPGMAQRLRQRDIDRYGNPEGPTFQNLLDEARGRGLSEEDALRSIIEDASETNSRTNNYLQIDSYSRPMHQMTVQAA